MQRRVVNIIQEYLVYSWEERDLGMIQISTIIIDIIHIVLMTSFIPKKLFL
jgi:hypothetical protein